MSPRASIPSSFAVEACFDGSRLVIHNNHSVAVDVAVTGASGPPKRTESDYELAALVARAAARGWKHDPNVLLPGDTLTIPIGAAGGKAKLRASPVGGLYLVASGLQTFIPGKTTGIVQAFTAMMKEVDDDLRQYANCETSKSRVHRAGCHVLLVRNVGFAGTRFVVRGGLKVAKHNLGKMLGIIDDAYEFSRWAQANTSALGLLVHSGTITIAPAVTYQPPPPTGSIRSWGTPTLISPRGLEGISCASTSFCVTVDDGGNAITFDGVRWSAPTMVSSSPLGPVSCPVTGFCVAQDIRSDLFVLQNGAWTRSKAPGGQSGPTSGPDSRGGPVSCVSSSWCMAVYAGLHGRVASVYDGSTWGAPIPTDDGNSITSLSCPSATFCMAADASGYVLTYDGSQWSGSTPLATTSDGGAGVTCTSELDCLGIDADGDWFAWDGTNWTHKGTAAPQNQFLHSISCPDSGSCVAIGVDSSTDLVNGTWTTPVIADNAPNGLESVSCPTVAFCVAVDRNGRAVIGTK